MRTSPVLNLHARGRIVGTTGEHPFWVIGQGWVRASSLRIGDELVSADGQKIAVEGIAPYGRTETVYNLEVESDHTYFVGEPAWDGSLWAHNAGAENYGGTAEEPNAANAAKKAAEEENSATKSAAETPNKAFPKDFKTKNTKNWSGSYKSEGEARNLARTKLGKNPVEVEPGKWRSADGKWQYRAKPGDLAENHIHLEELNPVTGEVLQNLHLRWPKGAGR